MKRYGMSNGGLSGGKGGMHELVLYQSKPAVAGEGG